MAWPLLAARPFETLFQVPQQAPLPQNAVRVLHNHLMPFSPRYGLGENPPLHGLAASSMLSQKGGFAKAMQIWLRISGNLAHASSQQLRSLTERNRPLHALHLRCHWMSQRDKNRVWRLPASCQSRAKSTRDIAHLLQREQQLTMKKIETTAHLMTVP